MQFVLMGFATILGLSLGIFVIWTSLKDKASKYAFGGAVHALMGNYEYADIRYKKALEFDREHFEALYYMAGRHAAEREFPQAVSFYERSMSQRPDDPNVLFKLGAVFYDMNHTERAIDLWKKFIEKSGNERNVKTATALLEKILSGEKEIFSESGFVHNFKWHEEGFSSSKKIRFRLKAKIGNSVPIAAHPFPRILSHGIDVHSFKRARSIPPARHG